MTFLDRLKSTVEEGLLFGIKWAIAILLIDFSFYFLTTDYLVVRQRAYNGELAYEALVKSQQSQTNGTATK